MLEVVFNDSVKGCMRIAKNYNESNYLDGPAAYIGQKPTQEEWRKMCEGKPIGGDRGDVIGIQYYLDIGDISGEVYKEERKNLIFDMFKNPFVDEKMNTEELEMFWSIGLSDLERLKAWAQVGKDIRIWWSDTPYSSCGYYYTNSLLKDYNCRVTAVKLPKYLITDENTVQTYTSWTEIHPGKLYRFLPLEREVSKAERSTIAFEWEKLKGENAPLRAVINGNLTSVPENFYDSFIRTAIPEGEFTVGKLLADLIIKYKFGASDWWLISRMNEMIKEKELIVVNNNDFVYQTIVRKVDSI